MRFFQIIITIIIIIIIIIIVIIAKQLRNRKNTQSYAQASNNFIRAQALNKSILFLTFSEATEELRKILSSITNTDKELSFPIERCQKWIICQNANIFKKFYEYV